MSRLVGGNRSFSRDNRPSVSPREWASWERLILAAIAVFSGLLLLCSMRYPVFRTDNVYMVVGAFSLVSGQGYTDISQPGNPLLTKYPPLPSISMAPLLFGSHHGLEWVRLISIAFQPAMIFFAYKVSRLRASPRVALAATALFAIHPTITWGHLILGNLGLTATFFLLVLWFHEGYNGRHRALWLAAALILASYCHRSAMVLAGISIIWLALKGSRREALTVAGLFALGIAPWCLRSYLNTGYWLSPEYQAEIYFRSRHCMDADHCDPNNVIRSAFFPIAALQYSLANLPMSIKAVGGGLFPLAETPLIRHLGPLGDPVAWFARIAVSWCVLVGWLQELRGRNWREIPFTAIYLPFHLGMISLIFPGIQYHTYLLAPLYLYAGRGLAAQIPAIPRYRLATATALLVFTFALLLLRNKTYLRYAGIPHSDSRDPRWSWVAQVTPPQAVVYWLRESDYAVPQWRWFDTGRKSVSIPKPTPATLARTEINYLALPTKDPLGTALRAANWRPLYHEPATTNGPRTLWHRPTN